MKPLYVLKIGGCVITEKDAYAVARKDVIERIVGEVVSAKSKHGFDLVFINGAGSFGHAPVKKYGIKDGVKNQEHVLGVAAVHKHVEDLNRMVWDAFDARNVAAVPVHPMSFVIANNGKFSLDTKIIREMLKRGIIPMLYGDIVMDAVRGSSIISGDDIAPMLGTELKADRVLMGTNTNGIFDKDPKKFKDARQIPEVNNSNWKDVLETTGESSETDVTGGMRGKLGKLVEYANGVECIIYDAQVSGSTERVLSGATLGTTLRVSL